MIAKYIKNPINLKNSVALGTLVNVKQLYHLEFKALKAFDNKMLKPKNSEMTQ